MVCTEDIYQPVESPPYFFPVIGDIRQSVGRFACTFNDNAILLLAKFRGLEPHRPIKVIDKSLFTKSNNYVINESFFVKGVFVVIGIKFNIEACKGVSNICKYLLFGLFPERFYIFSIFE